MAKAYLTHRPSELFADPFFKSFFGDREPIRFGDFAPVFGTGRTGWAPSVDVRETDNEFVFTAELPGLTREDVEITLEDNILTLSGERTFENEENKDQYHRIERSYGRFSRSFTLPHELDGDKVAAKYGDGLLTVTIPKAEKIKPRKIQIS